MLAGQKRKWANADTEYEIQQLDAQISALQQAQAAVIQQYQHQQQAAAQQPAEQAEPMDAEQQVAVWTAEAVQARAQLVATLASALREPEMRWRSRMCTMRSIRQLLPQDIAHLISLPGVRLVSLLREWLQAALQGGYGNRKLRHQNGERLMLLLKSLHRVDIAIWPVAEVQPVRMLLQQISRSVESPQAEAAAAELLAIKVVDQHSMEQQHTSNQGMLPDYVSDEDMLAEGMLEQQQGQVSQSCHAVSHENMFISPMRHLET